MIRLIVALFLLATPVAAEEIVSGLSQSQVAINANFDGSAILIYGAATRTSPPPDWPLLQVIITVEGPSSPLIVRHKERVAGIWINQGAVEMEDAPSFYAVATTGDLSDILSKSEDDHYAITVEHSLRAVDSASDTLNPKDYVAAAQRIRTVSDAYRLDRNSVLLLQQSLFRTEVTLPANLIEGIYKVRIFLTRGGKVIDMQESQINVQKAGLERFLFNLAQQQPLIYGLVSLLLAGLAGWGASEAFRRLRF
ncbi:MAG: TIGR02186 family protein [Paracoccaceae bacterium]